MSAVKLVPSLVPKGRKSAFSTDVICHACTIMVIRPGLYFAEYLRLSACEGFREILPLPAVGKEINGKFGLCFDRLGQLTIIGLICRLNKSRCLPKHQRLQERCEYLVVDGG